jgi:predicted alpha/beta superfamily hydrolase
MIKNNTLLSFLLLIFVFYTNAQVKEIGNITLGKEYTIQSKVLNETRSIQVYVPPSYKDSITKIYPVLYVLDGQDYFLPVVSFQNMLAKRGKFPEFIVVGLPTNNRKRRTLFGKDSKLFIDFLKSELITYIDTNYRTNKQNERLFFGWEVAGGLGIEMLANEPGLFSGYIIASPSNLWKPRLSALEKHLNTSSNDDIPFVLMTAATEESWLNENENVRSFFTKKKYENLNWRYAILEREEHHTTPFKTINEGIIDYFQNYKPVHFRTLKGYEDFGGLDGLTTFYKKRGERFGISKEIDNSTKMFVLYNAVLENNYERFLYYENAFEGYLETNTRDSWFHRYARFYLKHKNIEQARYFYEYALKKLGDTKLLYTGLGDVYAVNGDKRKAKKAYKQALKIDPKYKQALEGLKGL